MYQGIGQRRSTVGGRRKERKEVEEVRERVRRAREAAEEEGGPRVRRISLHSGTGFRKAAY